MEESSREQSNSHRHSLVHESVPSSSFSSISTSHVQENDDENPHQQQQQQQQLRQQQSSSIVSYRVNISSSDVTGGWMRDDAWSCLVVLVTFWFFASMTMILGIYGSVDLRLGPNYSRLIQTNPFFVQSIKMEQLGEQNSGSLMLYGFHKPPPLDVEIAWFETHNAVVPTDLHKEWLYFLNEGSNVDISYSVISPSSSPLSLVIARGSESLEEWIDDPSYPNTTLSWNIINGSGTIQQEISLSSNYYIAVGNLNAEEVEVQLNFTLKAVIYNTTKASSKCSLDSHGCSLTLDLLRDNAAILTSPGPTEDTSSYTWYVKLSYGPRWITYFVGSGVMTILILLAFRLCNKFQNTGGDGIATQAGDTGSERTPLLSNKDDDISSWGSSYDSVSQDEEDLGEWRPVNSLEGTLSNEGDNSNSRRVCVICCDAPRDCFFLPCGHCAACFTCGTRIAEEAGTCPICRRKMKKVRKIFTV